MKTFVTSDTHYSHANIVKYSKRPVLQEGDLDENNDWKSKLIARTRAAENDEYIIERHNALVGDDDLVYHLGDFAFGRSDTVFRILRRLKGQIRIIWGNHDKSAKDASTAIKFYPDLYPRVKFLGDYHTFNDLGESFVLFHYPILVWDRMHHGSYGLCGHSHGSCPQSNPKTTTTRLLDVGVDCHDYKPWELGEIVEHLKSNKYESFDRH